MKIQQKSRGFSTINKGDKMIIRNKNLMILGMMLGIALVVFLLFPMKHVFAETLKSPSVFKDVKWAYDHEASVIDENGWTQAMCATDKYLVCLENGVQGEPDTLIAFYKTDKDEDGYTVPQFSYARHVRETDYEHGNGMTFNPNTNELIIATGGPSNPDNRGSLMIADADTLEYKRTIKVTDMDVFFSGVDYNSQTNQYVLQMGRSGGYSFAVTDADFNILYIIDGVKRVKGTTFQDFCVYGDYIISISYGLSSGVDNYIQIYSISEKKRVGRYYLNFADYEEKREAEGICQIEPGKFIISTGVTSPRRIRFYSVTVPIVYNIQTEVVNGTVNGSNIEVDPQGECKITYNPDKHYELESITIDGEEIDVTKYPSEYTFSNVDKDHKISIKYKKIPKYKIVTSAENGTVSKSKSVYRGNNFKITFKPDLHYELDAVLLDGNPVTVEGDETEYILNNVQGEHAVDVIFKEVPTYEITTKIHGGKISEGTKKIYRGEKFKISYEAYKDSAFLLGILVDGKFISKDQNKTSYEFQNIQSNHSIHVIYVADFIPLCIIVVIVIVILLTGYIILTIKRRKRRIFRGRKRKKN